MAALSKAKLASDARHQAKLMQIMVKPYIEEGEAIKAAAKEAGQSTQAYILDAVRAKMTGDQPPEGRTRLTIGNDLLKKHQKDGETLAQTAQRLLKAGIEAESKR